MADNVIELLTIGPVHTILQDVVYALPARQVLLAIVTGTTVVLTADNDPAFSNPVTITLVDNQAFIAFAFIKATTITEGLVTLKAA